MEEDNSKEHLKVLVDGIEDHKKDSLITGQMGDMSNL